MSDNKKHSLLSPSASHRWIQCNPSARICESYEDIGSSYAAEGIMAHSVAEAKLRHRLGMTDNPAVCMDAEMDDYTDDYVMFVMEQLDGLSSPLVFVEQKVDCSRYIPECSGTCDALIISDGVLQICDFKYGAEVKNSAENNEQLMIYALGALEMFGSLYFLDTIQLSIFQPRLDICETWEISREALERWAVETLMPAAELAWKGEGEYRAGDHCRFCKAKAECRERANANMALAAYDFTDPPLLDADEIAEILGKVDALTSWASDVKEYALAEAMKGAKFTGWKVVAGRSNRKYTDTGAVAKAVTGIGFDPFEHKVLRITAMTSLLGKKRFEDTLGGLIEKPVGKPVLVPETDKRTEINITTAAEDFADHNEN